MNRENFVAFVSRTLNEVIALAEEKSGKVLSSRKIAFRWLGRSQPVVTENIVACVDIGVGDVLDDGTLLVVGSVAGYAPRLCGVIWYSFRFR
jgi:hypothetical protein